MPYCARSKSTCPIFFEKPGGTQNHCFFEDNSDTELHNIYGRLAAISIDYGVMEKSARVATIAGDFGWNDVGFLGCGFTI
jgi:mannose-1-phosphate guanylyltransferase